MNMLLQLLVMEVVVSGLIQRLLISLKDFEDVVELDASLVFKPELNEN